MACTPRPTLSEPEAFVQHTLLGAAAVSGAITVGLAVWGRWDWAAGFLAGAVVSLANFRMIARSVLGVVAPKGAPATRTLWRGALVRFAMSGALLVVALFVFRASLPALVAGLLITQVTMVVFWLVRAIRSLT